jgi:neutral ceramidase
VKIKAFWGVLTPFSGSLPTRLPLQAIRINDLLLIALPGEFTTEMGNRIMASAQQTARASHQKVQETAIIGLANEYSSYFTTPEEYDVQDYEGSSTLFGPRSGPFIEKKVGHLVEQMADASHHPQVEKSWTFTTGIVRRHFPVARAGFAVRQAIAVEVNCESLSPSASFSWRDLPPGAIGMDAPLARIEAERDGKWVPYVNDGVPEDDQGLNLEIRLVAEALDKDSAEWRATWYAAPPPAGSFRFVILKRDTVSEIDSEAVKFNCPAIN